LKRTLLVLLGGLTLAVSSANAQAPSPAPATSAAPSTYAPEASKAAIAPDAVTKSASKSATTGAPKIVKDGAGGSDKTCVAAGKKLDREQASLDKAHAEVARYDKLQQGCATKSACARYMSAIESLEKRVARHERRIEKFTASRDKACKKS
jgi:hypothetical protein